MECFSLAGLIDEDLVLPVHFGKLHENDSERESADNACSLAYIAPPSCHLFCDAILFNELHCHLITEEQPDIFGHFLFTVNFDSNWQSVQLLETVALFKVR
jgi:hypothetical protein